MMPSYSLKVYTFKQSHGGDTNDSYEKWRMHLKYNVHVVVPSGEIFHGFTQSYTAKINKSESTTQNTAIAYIQVFDRSMQFGEVVSKKA